MDNFSWSVFGENKGGSVNGYVNPCEKMKNDALDKFTEVGGVRVRPISGLACLYLVLC